MLLQRNYSLFSRLVQESQANGNCPNFLTFLNRALDVEHELPVARGTPVDQLAGCQLLLPIVAKQQHPEVPCKRVDGEERHVAPPLGLEDLRSPTLAISLMLWSFFYLIHLASVQRLCPPTLSCVNAEFPWKLPTSTCATSCARNTAFSFLQSLY